MGVIRESVRVVLTQIRQLRWQWLLLLLLLVTGVTNGVMLQLAVTVAATDAGGAISAGNRSVQLNKC